jgi:putative membrane protein
MNRIFLAALLLSTIGAETALAQTTTPTSTMMPTPATAAAPTIAPSATMTPAITTGATTPFSSAMPSAATTDATSTTTAAPVAGANSFTMAQAQKRIEDNGYTQVSALAKDDKSIWRGQAMKDGKTVEVALDYKGNVTTN